MKLYLVFQLIVINLNKLNGWGCGSFKGLKYHSHDRIVSGYDVGYHKFPWYAALYEYSTDVACGGALIGPKTVVTAAHCFREKLKLAAEGKFQLENLYRVKIGVYNNCNPHDTSQIFNVSKVVVHELYQKHDPYYDIAMLTLSDIAFNVPPICLPEKPMRKRPKVAIVTGLGTVRFKGSEPCTLKEARILTYSDQECRKMLNASEGTGNKLDKAFCAGYLQGGIDTCQGDSGGPLQILNKNGDYVLLGVVSFGYKCALPKMLGVYTDVSHYLDWIKENSGLSAKIVKEIYRPRPGPNQIGLHQQQSLYYIPPFRPAKIIVP